MMQLLAGGLDRSMLCFDVADSHTKDKSGSGNSKKISRSTLPEKVYESFMKQPLESTVVWEGTEHLAANLSNSTSNFPAISKDASACIDAWLPKIASKIDERMLKRVALNIYRDPAFATEWDA